MLCDQRNSERFMNIGNEYLSKQLYSRSMHSSHIFIRHESVNIDSICKPFGIIISKRETTHQINLQIQSYIV